MAKIPGTIPLGGTIAPTDSEDIYATHIANYGLGGLHHVDTIAERNAITAGRRVEGMLCTVNDSDGAGKPAIYQLVGGTENTNWEEFSGGGGGGGGGVEASYIRVSGSGKPIDTSLTGLEATETAQAAVVGEAFRFNSTTKLIEVTRDCIATLIGIGTAPAPTDRPSEDANGNFRVLLRRKRVGASGKGEILAEVRTFIRYARHAGALSCPINAQLFTGDTLNIETCCYDAARNPGELLLTVVEIPQANAGKDGKSAYQVAVDEGFDGTRAEWVVSLKGEKGDPGADGSDHGEPDAIMVTASGASFPASANTQVLLNSVTWEAGNGFRVSANKLHCLKDGVVTIIASSSTNPSSSNTADQGYIRLKLMDGSTDTAVRTSASAPPGPKNTAFNLVCCALTVTAGQTFYLVVQPDIAHTGAVTLQAAYLSANGLSAYEVAKKNGFQGSEEAWLLSLTDHRSPGEIVYSILPLADPRLVQLDGALLAIDGVYSATIASVIVPLATSHPNLFVTEAAWQQSVAQYGVCGKFVLDTTAGTLRLPKVSGFVQGTLDEQAIGDLVEAGLPGLKGWFSSRPITSSGSGSVVGASGAFSKTDKAGSTTVSAITLASGTAKPDSLTFDASAYNATYGKSHTVQPQAVKVFVYMVFAHGVKTPVLIEAENYVNDLNTMRGEMPVLAAYAASPSKKYINLSLPATGGTVTAPENGYLALGKIVTAASQYATLNNQTVGLMDTKYAVASGQCLRVIVPVSKGDVVAVGYTAAGTTEYFRFIYANGVAPAE